MDCPCVIKTAFTGTASSNIEGQTLHASFGFAFDNKHYSLFNGSNNSNWRRPDNFNEKSIQISEQTSSSFPSLQLVQTTPPPQRSVPPPTARLTASRLSAATPPNQTPNNHQFAKTPALNPYRIEKGTTFFPKTPKLLSPVQSSTVSSSELVSSIPSSSSNSATFNPDVQPSLECPASQWKPQEDNFEDELKNLFKSKYI